MNDIKKTNNYGYTVVEYSTEKEAKQIAGEKDFFSELANASEKEKIKSIKGRGFTFAIIDEFSNL